MNKQPSTSKIIFSYLLIIAITGVVITMDGAGKTFARSSMGVNEYAILDSIAIINAEAHLPIYAVPEKHSNAKSLLVERTQEQATIESAVIEEHPAGKHDYKDNWDINIASYTTRDKANRLVEHAREKGIDATQKYVSVNGRKFWRVSVKGFLSPDRAKSYATLLKGQLGLKEVWISKESDQPRSSDATS
jgi:cell division septation protein DedD